MPGPCITIAEPALPTDSVPVLSSFKATTSQNTITVITITNAMPITVVLSNSGQNYQEAVSKEKNRLVSIYSILHFYIGRRQNVWS